MQRPHELTVAIAAEKLGVIHESSHPMQMHYVRIDRVGAVGKLLASVERREDFESGWTICEISVLHLLLYNLADPVEPRVLRSFSQRIQQSRIT